MVSGFKGLVVSSFRGYWVVRVWGRGILGLGCKEYGAYGLVPRLPEGNCGTMHLLESEKNYPVCKQILYKRILRAKPNPQP